ncbi:MAG: SDR family oxidoreductase [Chloroflexi bacterium]|nr:MAG: SDR family oxidoreductase [Chloroflexota bacterium]
MKTVDGKVTLVTGGARGLGEAICRELSAAGAHVIIADVRMDLANQAASKMKQGGGHVTTLELNVMDENQIRSALDQINAEYGRLDVLVNSAGIDKTVSIEELSIEDWDAIMAVNLRAPFILSKYALQMMREQGSGYIINICSTGALRAWPNASAYHASKWGLLGFTNALHTEARIDNIKVTALIPGGMRTPFLLDRFPDLDPNNLQDPKNVAETIHFLLTMPDETVIPELLVLPMRETSWP